MHGGNAPAQGAPATPFIRLLARRSLRARAPQPWQHATVPAADTCGIPRRMLAPGAKPCRWPAPAAAHLLVGPHPSTVRPQVGTIRRAGARAGRPRGRRAAQHMRPARPTAGSTARRHGAASGGRFTAWRPSPAGAGDRPRQRSRAQPSRSEPPPRTRAKESRTWRTGSTCHAPSWHPSRSRCLPRPRPRPGGLRRRGQSGR